MLLFNSWPDAPPEGSVSTRAAAHGAAPALLSGGVPASACGATPFDSWKASSIVARGAADDDAPSSEAAAASAADTTPAASLGPTGDAEAAPSEASTAVVSRLMGGPRRRGRSVRFRCDELASSHAVVHAALHELVDASSFRIR